MADDLDLDLDAIEATARRKGYTDLYSGLALVAEVRRLRAIEDAARDVVAVMDDTTGEVGPDLSMCDYFRGIGSFGCQTEPSCQTDRWGPWPMEALRSALEVGRG